MEQPKVGLVLGATAHSPAERSDVHRVHQPPDAQQQQPAGNETAMDTEEAFPVSTFGVRNEIYYNGVDSSQDDALSCT